MIYNEIPTEELKALLPMYEKQLKMVMSAIDKEKERMERCKDLLDYREQADTIKKHRYLLSALRCVRNSVMEELDRRGVLLL